MSDLLPKLPAAVQISDSNTRSGCPALPDEREGRLRRMAERRNMRLRAAPSAQRIGYMLVDANTQKVILSGLPVRYSATLNDVARYLVG